MRWLALISLGVFAVSLILTAMVRALARRWGIVDRPDGQRKLHGRPMPLWGGMAVYGATVLGLLAVYLVGGIHEKFAELSTAWAIAAGCVCLVGGVDDRFDLPPRLKLALQTLSVAPIVLLGYHVDRVVAFGCPIELGLLGIPLTVLWLVGCINALNLIDGMDGLASLIGLSAAGMLGIIASSQGNLHVAAIAFVLAGALAGFLLYNLPPASIFLGDSGSMVIGLTIGLLGIQGTLKTSATLAITAPVVVMTLPMFDIVAAVVRRGLTGRRLDAPDRLHIHHRLLDRGWTPWQVLCLLGALCLTTGAAATAATIFRRDALAWIAAMTLIVLMIRLRLFGHEEFALVKEAVVRALKPGFRHEASEAASAGLEKAEIATSAASTTSGREANVPLSWDGFLHRLQAWDICQAEFDASFGENRRRIRWIDPKSPPGQRCRWSLWVSLPGPGGELCELRAGGSRPVVRRDELTALTSMLKDSAAHFAACTDELFGPAVAHGDRETEHDTNSRRKAA
ncbi:MAG: undecaprenyl/decaprenyl-phosphate alpha-N-acetylglucosaminyl 1-phosphate transferase [Planctomycetaceae bacterium]|nr:undecaprenyl/decaprenyl-phosphate alpha-N-acetylglucosaminyl 1-phosphate transferase [Planctomycetaceae bacterium]